MVSFNRTQEETLNHEYLLSILDYDEKTGIFKWKVHMSSNALPGNSAGHINNGYIRISIGTNRYYAHRLAWFYVYKEWPVNQIDHIDQNPLNNSISNLRDVTQSVNQHNTKDQLNNQSGTKGVWFDQRERKWVASIAINGKRKYLGSFMDKKFAIKARKEAEKSLQMSEDD